MIAFILVTKAVQLLLEKLDCIWCMILLWYLHLGQPVPQRICLCQLLFFAFEARLVLGAEQNHVPHNPETQQLVNNNGNFSIRIKT